MQAANESFAHNFPISQGGVISALAMLKLKELWAYSSSKSKGMLKVCLTFMVSTNGVFPALIDTDMPKLEMLELVSFQDF